MFFQTIKKKIYIKSHTGLNIEKIYLETFKKETEEKERKKNEMWNVL